jgi:short subunit dehydrogenase-like uncharacterized protein
MARPYDVVLYGASGFVGRQTVAYFARHGTQVRWAVAGRSDAKLREALQAAGVPHIPMVVADAQDAAALKALTSKARVVLSTAGPFALYGSALVAACVETGTHYVDITGETPWVRDMIDRHHDTAQRQGTRIVPCCGFDSVPSDIGAWLVVQAMRERHGQACVELKASHSIKGGLNGGTLASMVNMLDGGDAKRLSQPFLLNPEGSAPADVAPHADPFAPHHDADFDAWLGPFVMGPINTRVVRRSAALLHYGAAFRYQEYMRFGRGPAAAVAAAGMSAATLTGQGLTSLAPMRKFITGMAALGPKPGEGPSVATMDGGSFRCELVGKSAEGHVVRATVADAGDPGNRATTKFVCESALALALNEPELPRAGGVITPAAALGDTLVRRLRAAGMTLSVQG